MAKKKYDVIVVGGGSGGLTSGALLAKRGFSMDAVVYKEVEGPAEVYEFTRDRVLPGQGGECVGLAQIVGQCGKSQPSARAWYAATVECVRP